MFGIFYTTAWLVTTSSNVSSSLLPAANVVNNFNQIMKTLALSSMQPDWKGVRGEGVDRETTIVTDCNMLASDAQLEFA